MEMITLRCPMPEYEYLLIWGTDRTLEYLENGDMIIDILDRMNGPLDTLKHSGWLQDVVCEFYEEVLDDADIVSIMGTFVTG